MAKSPRSVKPNNAGKQSLRETKKQLRAQARELERQRKAGLKQFRHDIAILKRAGIVSKKTDARKVQVSRHFNKLRKDFASVLKGEAKAVKVNKAAAAKYKAMGFAVQGHRVAMVKQAEGSRFFFSPKTGEIRERFPTARGIATKVVFPIPFEGMQAYLDELATGEVDTLKTRHEYWAFELYGNRSFDAFPNAKAAALTLSKYVSINAAIALHSAEQELDIFNNLAWIKLPSEKEAEEWRDWHSPANIKARKKAKEKARREAARKKRGYEAKFKTAEQVMADFEAKKERDKKYRKNLDAEKLAAYKERAKARSRAKRKKG